MAVFAWFHLISVGAVSSLQLSSAMMDSMMESNGVILEEQTVTGHADSISSHAEPEVMKFCREMREAQSRPGFVT